MLRLNSLHRGQRGVKYRSELHGGGGWVIVFECSLSPCRRWREQKKVKVFTLCLLRINCSHIVSGCKGIVGQRLHNSVPEDVVCSSEVVNRL